MTHFLLRRSLLGSVLVLFCLVPLALRPTATWSAATSSTTILAVEEQVPQLATGNWYGWQNLGYLNGTEVDYPVIGRNQDGHLEIFASTEYGTGVLDKAVYRRNQIGVNGTSWTAWASLGTLEPGTSAPAVATDPAGRLEVFATGVVSLAGTCTYRTAIKHIYQTAPNNGWSSWGNLGQPSTACYLVRPFVGMNSDGRLDVFARGSDGDFHHRWQTAPSGGWSAGWDSLGAPPSGATYSEVAVSNNADGRIALFVAAPGSGGYGIYHAWQNTVDDEYSWSAWTGLGKPSASVDLYPPTVAQNQDGRLDVFSLGSDGNLWHKWQVAPNSYWSSGWEDLGQPSTSWLIGYPTASRQRDGRLVVFARAADGAIWSIAQKQASGSWGSWTSLGQPSGTAIGYDIAVGRNQNGTLVIATTDALGRLWWNYERIQVFLPLLRK